MSSMDCVVCIAIHGLSFLSQKYFNKWVITDVNKYPI